MKPGLYVVATPIGNLGDISPRAVDVLRDVELIAAEDTRHSQRLLQHFAITTPAKAYHDHSGEGTINKIATCLAEGKAVALISDAGTPLISDPGYRLVREVQKRGYDVFPVPGACAAIAALSISGLPTDRFLFEGFLPAKTIARENRLRKLAGEPTTLIFYEAPHRILESLESLQREFGGDREALLARELTKTFETVRRATLSELVDFVAADTDQRKGEIVLIVAGQREQDVTLDEQTAALLRRLAEELPAKRASAVVADVTGLRKKLLYQYLLSVKEGS